MAEKAAAGTILEKLLSLLVEVAHVFTGVHRDVAEIMENLDSIKMVAAAEQTTRMRKLVEAAFRIEYLIDAYIISEEQQPRNPGVETLPYLIVDYIKTLILRLQVAYEIPNVKSCVTAINGLGSGSSTSTGSRNDKSYCLRDAAWHKQGKDVGGFEASTKELTGLFEKTPEKRTVILVVGMGGQGKTALAKTVYDQVIKDDGGFDCHATIMRPDLLDTEDLLKKILEQFQRGEKMAAPNGEKEKAPPKHTSEMGGNSLTDEVKNYLREKRYVIFFDDVWKEKFWRQIQFALLDNEKGSRILITTRNKKVAEYCKESSGVHVHVHNLQPLTNTWKLICEKVFENKVDELCLQKFKSKNFNIIKKCEGLPLGFEAIARLCRRVTNGSEWTNLDSDQSLLWASDYLPEITNILGLSFDDLPSNLKSCFLYFGMYPENYDVETSTLIRQWIAEGFVKYEVNKTLEEVAEQYLEVLIQRSLVQVPSLSIDGKPKRCRVHALMREMILKKIEDLCFCMFAGRDSVLIRRLQIQNKSLAQLPDDSVKNYLMEKSPYIRSLHIFRGKELPEDFVKKIPTRYRLLKVLDFKHTPLNCVPQDLGNLFRLRYLSFRNTNIDRLPNSIGNLQNLETLDLRQTSVRQMPIEINKLRKLQHLLANHTSWGSDYGIQMMEGVGGLVSLQTLRQVETDHRGVELIAELEKLEQLRLLGLIHVKGEYISALCESINKMHQLKKLHIDAINSDEVIDLDSSTSALPALQNLRLRGKLERLPKWIPNLEELVKLSLKSSKLTDDSLESVKQLPKLLSLSLDSAYEGESLHFKDGEFKELKKLSLRYLHSLNSIIVDEKALPLLQEFKLEYIPQLKEVPPGINHLSKLEILSLMSITLTNDPLQSLKNMPNLMFLSLDSAYKGKSLHFEDNGFQKLKKLSLRHLKSLNCIIIGEEALPMLEEFELEDIPHLKEVPSGIQHLGNLGVFHIIDMAEEFRRRIQEDQWINMHVIQVNIID